jgi:hypothetical protein
MNWDPAKCQMVANSFEPTLPLEDWHFESLDLELLVLPRQANGDLPNIPFMKPARDSPTIDIGVDVGLPFHGGAPDLGAFESTHSK